MRARFKIFVLLAVAVAFVYSCGKNDSSPKRSRGMSRGRPAMNMGAIPVKVEKVKREPISIYLLSNANIEALRKVDVVSRVSGLVQKITVEEGDYAPKNRILAELDDRELRLEVKQALAKAENNARLFQRSKEMYSQNLISKENFDDVKYQYETAKSQLEAAQLKLTYAKIRAPISGVITQRLIELGNNVGVNQKVFVMVNFDTLYARVFIPEKDIQKIHVGQRALVTVEAYPGREFWGHVKMINPIVDPESGTVKVTVMLLKKGTPLRPGMFATVKIITETHPHALVIPKRALLLESETDRVFVVQDSVARQRDVKLGFADGDRVEVLSGLNEGDWVVVVGQEGLQNGAYVRMVTETGTAVPAESPRAGIKPAASHSSEIQKNPPRPPLDARRLKRFKKFLLRVPEIKKEYEARVKRDPSFEKDIKKQADFFRAMREKYADKLRMRPR
ncbi:MAG: efflux RND transporter periplasmic adaptor subunit [Calditrichaeota bacterium]|nr:efflux RND transporter periplasmic adaptor subunit [Calditrichota bacterium]